MFRAARQVMVSSAPESVPPSQRTDDVAPQCQYSSDSSLSLFPAPEQASAIAKLCRFEDSNIIGCINALRALSPCTHDHLLALSSLRCSPDDDVRAWLAFGHDRASELIALFPIIKESTNSLRRRYLFFTAPELSQTSKLLYHFFYRRK